MIIDQNNRPLPRIPMKFEMECSCPDGAGMCKHIAAVLYGIGACLDTKPEWLFTLRHVDHLELIAEASVDGMIATSEASENALEQDDLSTLFGIEIAPTIDSK